MEDFQRVIVTHEVLRCSTCDGGYPPDGMEPGASCPIDGGSLTLENVEATIEVASRNITSEFENRPEVVEILG